jgi:tetratricopeptide (TPR) repeat protein
MGEGGAGVKLWLAVSYSTVNPANGALAAYPQCFLLAEITGMHDCENSALHVVTASLSSFSNLLDNHAAKLLREGRLEEALRAAATALGGLREAVEMDPRNLPDLFSGLQLLAAIQRELGDAVGAEAACGEALEIAARSDAVPRGEVARVRTQLATLLDFSQREAEAAPLYEQAIADYEALTPPDVETAAQLRNNLAMIYKGLGRYALAEQHYLRALETLEARRGRSSEDVGSVYNNLGSLYYTAGFPMQAAEMFGEALDIRRQLLGPDHPDVGQSYGNLATVSHALADDAAALGHFEQSLRILEQHANEDPASFEAVAFDCLALLERLGEERKAAALRRRIDKALGRS